MELLEGRVEKVMEYVNVRMVFLEANVIKVRKFPKLSMHLVRMSATGTLAPNKIWVPVICPHKGFELSAAAFKIDVILSQNEFVTKRNLI